MFPAALKSGRRLLSPNFSVIVPEAMKGYAIIIPKKITRLSSTRHRIKRRISMVLRTLPLPPSLIVFPKASASSVSYQDIRSELSRLLSQKHP